MVLGLIDLVKFKSVPDINLRRANKSCRNLIGRTTRSERDILMERDDIEEEGKREKLYIYIYFILL